MHTHATAALHTAALLDYGVSHLAPQGPLQQLSCASISLGGPVPAVGGSGAAAATAGEGEADAPAPPAWLPITLHGLRLQLGRRPSSGAASAEPKKKKKKKAAGMGGKGLPSWLLRIAAKLLPGTPITLTGATVDLLVSARMCFHRRTCSMFHAHSFMAWL